MNENAITQILEGVLAGLLEQQTQPAKAQCAQPVCTPAATGVCSDPIPVELSARHVHLSEADALALFGKPLTHVRDISQPGQFLCEERVRLIGPKGVMDNVAVLGPARGSSQVEITKTDARALGVDAPVRHSGDINGTPGIILATQHGIVGLQEGVMVAARHIHMTPADAARYGVTDNALVNIHINGERPVVLEDVLVRVSDAFKLAMHIDPDEGNSSGWNSSIAGTIVAITRGADNGLCNR